jgi:hypothetical protein
MKCRAAATGKLFTVLFDAGAGASCAPAALNAEHDVAAAAHSGDGAFSSRLEVTHFFQIGEQARASRVPPQPLLCQRARRRKIEAGEHAEPSEMGGRLRPSASQFATNCEKS